MSRKSIFQRMFASFSRDAEPEDIREAARAIDSVENGEPQPPQQPPKPTEDEDGNLDQMVLNAIHELNENMGRITERLESLEQSQMHDEDVLPQRKSALDTLEDQLAGKNGNQACDDDPTENEESVTVPPEQLNDEEPEELDAEQEEKSDTTNAQDRAISIAMLRAIKPIIADMPQAQRRRASDALSVAVRRAMKVQDTQPLNGGYGVLAQRRTADAAAKMADARAFGENCRKRNPHYQHKEEK